MPRFRLISGLAVVAGFAFYFDLASQLGFGRALLAIAVVLFLSFALILSVAGVCIAHDGRFGQGSAAILLAVLIFCGAGMLAFIVFQSPSNSDLSLQWNGPLMREQ